MNEMIDDSALFHGGVYDAARAHEYYLKNRQLKGRKRAAPKPTSSREVGRRPTHAPPRVGGKPNRSDTKSRRAELLAQKKALEKRLDRLREVLEEAVKAAKKRSGSQEKDRAPEEKHDKADRNKAEKGKNPLTQKQKREKAKKAKEDYEKEHPNSLSQDVKILHAQIADIQAKIKKALSDAQDHRNKAGQNDSKSGSKNHKPSGPRGR